MSSFASTIAMNMSLMDKTASEIISESVGAGIAIVIGTIIGLIAIRKIFVRVLNKELKSDESSK